MMSLHDPLTLAGTLVAGGDVPGAIAQYDRFLTPLFAGGPAALAALANGPALVSDAARALTELLRWNRRFAEAIALQHQMAHLLPEDAPGFRILAARLMVEAGMTAQGLALLQAEAAALQPSAGLLLMGEVHAWLLDYASAETCLAGVCADIAAPVADRAAACDLRFNLFGMQKKIPEAISAWEAARELDADRDTALPDLLRMLIYWYQYETAASYIDQDSSDLRRTFYRNLILTKTSGPKGRKGWEWVQDYDPAHLILGHQEYAEAALRCAAPGQALAVLMPLHEKGVQSRPLVLTGLAFAQQRDLPRAHWALRQALRLADQDAPRRTRPGVETGRIFDAETRITYAEVPIDPDIRPHLDPYFMPVHPLH